MRNRRLDLDRQDVVARRLALLSPVPLGEPSLALTLVPDPSSRRPGARPEPPGPEADERAPVWWDEHTRVRPVLAPGDLQPAPSTEALRAATGAPVAVPVPGRHASRRPVPAVGWADRLPRLGVAHLAVVAVLVALALAATSWWVVRSEPVPVSAEVPAPGEGPTLLALPTPPAAAPAAGGPTGAGGSESPGSVVVDVAGKVRRPGVRELPAGSRVVDAIEAAGGARPGVDLSGLNLARVLVDGEQVLVGATGPAGAAGPAGTAGTTGSVGPATGAPGAPAAPAALVDLNTADQAALEALPEIGPVTAQAIIAWRQEHGGFTAVQELLEVDGIGPATLETVAPLVTV